MADDDLSAADVVRRDFTVNLPGVLREHPKIAQEVGAVFLFRITGEGGGTWTVDCRDNLGVHDGEVGDIDCGLELSAADWMTVSKNPATAMQLYFAGKLRISGDATQAMKLGQLLAG